MAPFLSRLPYIGALAFLLLAVGCAAPTGETVTTAFSAEPRTDPPSADYVIGPGDGLQVFVYRSPELSVDVPVRPDGRISMPLVSEIDAAGRTPVQLGQQIEERLRAYVREPVVTVIVRSFVGPSNRQIRIVGEAAQPRAIPYRDGLTVLDVLIQGGGLTRFAAGNRARIVRRERDSDPAQVIPVRLNDLLRSGDISQDLMMRPGDTLIIPQGWF